MGPSRNAIRRTILNEEYTDEHRFINRDGLYLWTEIWRPKSNQIKAVLFLSHGYAEHCNIYYEHLVKYLLEKDILVLAHDHMCQGRSEGERIFFTDMHVFSRDVVDHLTQFLTNNFGSRDKYPPVFIFGHSLGGMISILTALERPDLFERGGVILTSPLVVAAPDTATPFRIFLVKALSFFTPRMPIAPLDLEYISRDPAVKEEVAADPLQDKSSMKAGVGAALFTAIEEVQSKLDQYKPVTLLCNGTEDKLTHVSGALLFKEKAVNCKELTVELFEGAYHQLLRELPDVREKHMNLILSWLDKRLQIAYQNS